MKKWEIVLDDESDRILDSLAGAHSGDRNLAIREALHMHHTMEALLDQLERPQLENLRTQRARSERGFRQGKFTKWGAVKRKTGL